MDHTFGTRDFAWARVSGQHYDLEGSGGHQGLSSSTVDTPLNIGASWVHTFSPNSVLETQFGRAFYQKQSAVRFAAGTSKINQDTGFNTDFCCSYRSGESFVPNVAVAQYFSGGESAETATYGNVWQYKANHTLIRGRHELKFGGEWDNLGFQDVLDDLNVGFDTPQTADPQNQGKTGSPLASFLLDVPLSGGRRDFYKSTRPGGILGLYAQDSWKATPAADCESGLAQRFDVYPPAGQYQATQHLHGRRRSDQRNVYTPGATGAVRHGRIGAVHPDARWVAAGARGAFAEPEDSQQLA